MSMTMNEIERALRELRLSGILATLSTRILQAQANQEPFLDTFSMILQDELDRRRSCLMERRYNKSGLDERATLTDFDWRFNPKLPRQACFELHTLKFIAEGENALIIGKPGTGKSHVAKAVAYQATLQGHDVRYLEADSVFAQYALGNNADQERLLHPLLNADLVVLDDLFLARRISDSGRAVIGALCISVLLSLVATPCRLLPYARAQSSSAFEGVNLPNLSASVGNTSRFRTVEVSSPPRITMAIGPSISRPAAPAPRPAAADPSPVTRAVIRIGSSRSDAPRWPLPGPRPTPSSSHQVLEMRNHHDGIAHGDAKERHETNQRADRNAGRRSQRPPALRRPAQTAGSARISSRFRPEPEQQGQQQHDARARPAASGPHSSCCASASACAEPP